MSWGTKYKAYTNFHRTYDRVEVLLQFDSYASTEYDISDLLSPVPLMGFSRGQITDHKKTIFGREASLEFIALNDGTYDDLLEIDPYEVKFIINSGATSAIGSLTYDNVYDINPGTYYSFVAQKFTIPSRTMLLDISIGFTVGGAADVGVWITKSDPTAGSDWINGSIGYSLVAVDSPVSFQLLLSEQIIPTDDVWMIIGSNEGTVNTQIRITSIQPTGFNDLYITSDVAPVFSWDNKSTGGSPYWLASTIQGVYYPDFEGYVNPNDCERNLLGMHAAYMINASDGIGLLKTFDYYDSANNGPYLTRERGLTIIKRCLDNLNITFGFNIQLNTLEDSMTAQALYETYFNQQQFFSKNSGSIKYDNCFEVLEKILFVFNCTLKQSDGAYWIVCRSESNSTVTVYPNSLASSAQYDSDLTFNIDNFGFIYDNSRLQKLPPFKKITLNIKNTDQSDNLISNGDFSNSTTGWNNGPISGDFFGSGSSGNYAFNVTFAVNGTGFEYGKLHLEADDGHDKYFYTDTFTVTIGTNYTFKLTFTTHGLATPSSVSPNIMAFLIENPTGHAAADNIWQADTLNPQILSSAEVTYTAIFNMSGRSDGSYCLAIYYGPLYDTYTDTEAYFNNFDLRQTYEYLYINDHNISITPNSGTGYIEDSNDVWFYDSTEGTINESAALFDGTSLTSSWDRYGETDGLLIQQILAKQLMNNYQAYKNVITIIVENDFYQQIRFHNFIVYQSKTYMIAGFEKDYYNGTNKLTLIEILTSDVAATVTDTKLLTNNGS